jgi:hypothetical protein
VAIGEIMRKLLFFLILIFASIGYAAAWEETFEGHWYDEPYIINGDAAITSFEHGKAIRVVSNSYNGVSIYQEYPKYLRAVVNTSSGYLRLAMQDNQSRYVYYVDNIIISNNSVDHTVEFIESADTSSISVYVDGVYKTNSARAYTSGITKVSLSVSSTSGIYLDDISTTPYCVAENGYYDSADTLAYFTTTIPYNEDYPYYVQLSTDTGASISQWNLTKTRETFSFNPITACSQDGIYYLDIYSQTDGKFFYTKPLVFFSNGVYPNIFFIAETDTAAEIRDESNNGGVLTSGESVYLYPSTKANGYYNITCKFSESAYSREVDYTKVYNTTTLAGSIFYFSGLQGNTYNISVNNNLLAHSSGVDTWSYTADWKGNSKYTIKFEPDYSVPGIWGYVKSSVTQNGLQSASVTLSNNTFSTTIRTDINGMYYYADGITAGESYNIQVSKTGYDKPAASSFTAQSGLTTRKDVILDPSTTSYPSSGSGIYYAPHDVGFTVLEYWYSGAGLAGVTYTIYNGTEQIKTGSTDTKGMFTGSDMTGGTNYTIILTHNGTTYTEYVEPSQTEYTFVLNKEGILNKYANSWLNLTFTQNTNNVTIDYAANKTINGASLTAKAANGTIIYSQTLNSTTGNFTFVTGGEGDYTLNFHIQATDGDTASQSWGLSYPDKIPLFPDSYPTWLKNVLFSGIVMVFLLAFGKSKNDIACGAVAILTSMGYMFEWFTGSFYFVVLVWIIALGAVFLHYKRTGGIG